MALSDFAPQPAQRQGPPTMAHDSEQSDEELALLPRGTVVKIIGNARTKQALLNKIATVVRAQGLGGWHFLVLETGEEIKLQRNALLVLEHPSGNVQDFSDDEHEEQRRLAEQQQRRQRQFLRQQQLEVAEYEDSRVRQRRAPRPLIAEEYGGSSVEKPRVAVRALHPLPSINLSKLDVAALKRYRTYYQLPEPAGPSTSKDDLVSMVAQHWAEQTVDEAEVISHFLRAARRHSMAPTQWRH